MSNQLPHLLPNNGTTDTPEQKALSDILQPRLPVEIRSVVNPAETPDDFLPFLAQHKSVDLWFEDWTDERKRRMVAEAYDLAAIKGTRSAAERFLDYVDAVIIHKVSHPAVRPIGRYAIGIHPIAHGAQLARFLVKVMLQQPKNGIIVGRSAIGRSCIRPPSTEPEERAKKALVVAKSPETAFTVTFAHRVRKTLDDVLFLDGNGHNLEEFKDRQRL